MKIPVHYYFQGHDFSGIIRISSQWTEEPGGYQNEYIDERIAAKKNNAFYLVDACLKIRTMGGKDFYISKEEPISKSAYDGYCEKHGGIVDTPQYRKFFNEIVKIEREIEDSFPSCPKCKAVMTERSGRYGPFWGCSAYPKCEGTRKLDSKSAEIKRLRDRLSDLKGKLAKLEK